MATKFTKLLSMMLAICMVISMLPVVAFAATPDVVYLKPNSEWLADGARFAAYFYGNGDAWVDCTDADGDGIYEAAVPEGFTSVIFCRMNPADGSNNWDNKWNQTSDLALPTDGNNCYNVEGWDFGNGYWSTYTPKSETVDYYLVGFINGANYGCEEDHQNMGDYKFVDGKLVVTFSSDSYVFVKTTDNAKWYMAESYCADTSCKLVTSGNEKMFVPGNAEVTFKLVVNEDDSVTLSYTANYLECSHDYSSKITTEATCTDTGVKTFTCSKCGDSYTEAIPATGHSFDKGECTICGAADPDYIVDYYLVGFINGANYGCEEDYLNMGQYKFAKGKLVVTFASDSYVFVKTTDNAKWYMAESYCDDTSCKLVTNGTEKMFVPGNAEVTFTLVVNEDGTLTLSYTAEYLECQHSYSSQVTTEATCTSTGVMTYTCSKCADTYTEEIPMTSHSYVGGT
ncbi:MAG: hypothetical protein E7466_07270, partial [Ruminococcaceae bacterium]|nr:hypothetical protein [Oscillospiraceae bacterium]